MPPSAKYHKRTIIAHSASELLHYADGTGSREMQPFAVIPCSPRGPFPACFLAR